MPRGWRRELGFMTRVVIIADDLTGALDTASPFASRGARTICVTSADAVTENALPDCEVLAVSTNTRHLQADEASAVVHTVAEAVKRWQPDIVLKKVDSRLKGNVGNETAVIAKVFGIKTMPVVPAAPDIGRYVKGGTIIGHGVAYPIAVAERFAGYGFAVDIPEVTSLASIRNVVQGYLKDRQSVFVCSRGFAVTLAEQFFPTPPSISCMLEDPVLVVIGSRDEVTARQRELLCASGKFTCLECIDGRVPAMTKVTQQLLLFCSGDIQQNPAVVAEIFSDGVRKAAQTMKPKTLLCSGGDTAKAVLSSFGRSFLEVLGEVAPGLPVSCVNIDSDEVKFVSKSGGFGEPLALLELFTPCPARLNPN